MKTHSTLRTLTRSTLTLGVLVFNSPAAMADWVQKYLSKTAHAYDALVLLASYNFMKQLTDAQRQAIHEAADEATVYERQTSRELNSKLLDELKQSMTINDVSASKRQRMRDALQPLTKRYTERLDPAVVSAFEQALASSRQQ
ncbi:hypothetical protein [Pokkaliibacter plantistimulans]|uniref:hypothetical protein n=1 Tax=Pokkaliibacter plantistimulans TaxID=1635171 RepID=UPI001403F400|nr:hypothetical protein [Pokkaliibacter plantistimulans]